MGKVVLAEPTSLLMPLSFAKGLPPIVLPLLDHAHYKTLWKAHVRAHACAMRTTLFRVSLVPRLSPWSHTLKPRCMPTRAPPHSWGLRQLGRSLRLQESSKSPHTFFFFYKAQCMHYRSSLYLFSLLSFPSSHYFLSSFLPPPPLPEWGALLPHVRCTGSSACQGL